MVDLCQEAAATTGPVSLFLGIETAHWSAQQFKDAGQFAKEHGITCLFLKCFEVGSQAGDIWYGGLAGVDTNINLIKAAGVQCIPYGFLYGDTYGTLSKEIDVARQLLSKYGVLCLDMEGKYWAAASSAGWAKQIAAALQPIPGQVWVSCPANPVESGQLPFLQAMAPATNAFMPMAYNDYLAGKYPGDFAQLGQVCVQPTIDLSPEFGANNVPAIVAQILAGGAQAISIWEYGFAQNLASLLDQAVALFHKGGASVPLDLSPAGCVCDIAQSNQLDNAQGESQDMCGPWTVAGLKFAGLPGKGALATGAGHENPIDDWAEAEYTKYIGPNVISNQAGSSIENMHQFFHDAGNLHYWDIGAISAGSAQASDLARIRTAVRAGYPVVITASEPSIHSKSLGKNPYPWQPALGAVNHIFAVIGIDKDGDFIVADQLNSFEPWPQIYLSGPIACSWASVIQLVGPDPARPWLKPIPSGDPMTWPQGFNAQDFAAPAPPPVVQPPAPPPVDHQAQSAENEWNATATGAPFDTGIAKAWLADYRNSIFHGPPLGKEFQTVRWDGSPLISHCFAGARCDWHDDAPHWYDYK